HDYAADYPERGAKSIYRSTGGFGTDGRDFTVNGEGPAEIDTVVDIIFDHKDTDGRSAVARFITGKLLTYFAQPGAKRPVSPALKGPIDEIIASSGFDSNWEIRPLLRAMFVHDSFYETAAAAPFTASTKKAVKWPIDFVVGTLRMLDMKITVKEGIVRGG